MICFRNDMSAPSNTSTKRVDKNLIHRHVARTCPYSRHVETFEKTTTNYFEVIPFKSVKYIEFLTIFIKNDIVLTDERIKYVLISFNSKLI